MDKKEVDLKLSEEVATQAGKEINELKKEINTSKDVQLSLLQDVLSDVRDQRLFFKKLCVILCIFIFMMLMGIVTISISNQKILSDVSYRNVEKILYFLEKADVKIDTSELQ